MLEGAFNFRDLGGLRTRDGRRLRPGRLFRSDTLQALTAADAQRLYDAMGLRGVVDLRLAEEVQAEGRGPLATYSDIRYANAPLHMAATENVPADQVMERLYLGCLAPEVRLTDALQHLEAMADQPVVFHCAAGKDRTGVVAAILLRLLGVADEDIVADYLRSAEPMPRMVERFATWPRYREHMARTPPQAYAVEAAPLLALMHALDHVHGGTLRWALAQGMPMRTPERLAQLWLE